MIPRTIQLGPIWNVVGEIAIRTIKNVAHEDRTVIRNLVIEAPKKIVLPSNIGIVYKRLSGARCGSGRAEEFRRIVRQRIKRHRVSNSLPHGRIRVFSRWCATNAACCRRQELVRTGIWNRNDIRDDLLLAQPFVVPEKECFVPFDRPAEAPAKLILMIRRRLSRCLTGFDDCIEKIPRFEFVVTQKLVRRSVQSIRARAAGSINDGTISAKLCSVGIRERLEFSDRFDTKRRAQAAGARPVVPEIYHVLIIE